MISRILAAVMILSAVGCAPNSPEKSASQYFVTTNAPVEFLFPPGWHNNDEDHPFDLQCLSEDEQMNTGVFLFVTEDLAEAVTPMELFELQIDDMRSKRENFRIFEEVKVVRREAMTLTTAVYSGENGSSRAYYKFTLVEFAENREWVPVLLQVSVPSSWDKNKPVLERIAASGRVRPLDSPSHR